MPYYIKKPKKKKEKPKQTEKLPRKNDNPQTIQGSTTVQIKIYQGVLSKRINYIELYRVYDYEEKQSFIQSLINNTNIYIYSGDKSTPELLMNGLKANSDIIQTIRNRVEEQKKKKGIYEFTNR